MLENQLHDYLRKWYWDELKHNTWPLKNVKETIIAEATAVQFDVVVRVSRSLACGPLLKTGRWGSWCWLLTSEVAYQSWSYQELSVLVHTKDPTPMDPWLLQGIELKFLDRTMKVRGHAVYHRHCANMGGSLFFLPAQDHPCSYTQSTASFS